MYIYIYLYIHIYVYIYIHLFIMLINIVPEKNEKKFKAVQYFSNFISYNNLFFS